MTSQTSIQVYLVRSAATDWQSAGRVQGSTDLPAAADDLAAIRAAAAAFAPDRHIGLLAHAPDEASRQTAALFAEQMTPPLKVRTIDTLTEMNLGLWQGLTIKDLGERYPKAFGQWQSEPARVAPPEGEVLEQAGDRLTAALAKLLTKTSAGEALMLVLRPIMYTLARAELTRTPVTTWPSLPEGPLVERFELDTETLQTLRSTRRKKRVTA